VKFGGLDIAFNNAGIVGNAGSVPDMALESWRERTAHSSAPNTRSR
jgi:NAD(P)-dependent dehydrogenase (short-subunit alcohol dehydrogenase family)